MEQACAAAAAAQGAAASAAAPGAAASSSSSSSSMMSQGNPGWGRGRRGLDGGHTAELTGHPGAEVEADCTLCAHAYSGPRRVSTIILVHMCAIV